MPKGLKDSDFLTGGIRRFMSRFLTALGGGGRV